MLMMFWEFKIITSIHRRETIVFNFAINLKRDCKKYR
jgi:hypothetical protein